MTVSLPRLAAQADRVRRTVTNLRKRAGDLEHPRGAMHKAPLLRVLDAMERGAFDLEAIIADWPEATTELKDAS